MVEKSHFAKSIMDVSWNQFRQFLTYKAEDAGRKLGVVNPAYTTQECYSCGQRKTKKLTERMHCCIHCGYKATRDLNAAKNILALGLDGLGIIPRSLSPLGEGAVTKRLTCHRAVFILSESMKSGRLSL